MTAELRLQGCYFKHEYGKTIKSHAGKPGVELTLPGRPPVYLDHEQCALVAKTIGRLYGSSSEIVLNVSEGSDA